MSAQTDDLQPVRRPGRIIARNTMFGVGATVALRVAGFLFTILVVRTLGDTNFGQYSIVLAWAGLFSFIGDIGITQYLGREIARDPQAAERLFWDTVTLRLILGIITSVITVVGALLLTDYNSDIILGIGIYTSTYAFMSLIVPMHSLLMGNEHVDVISVINVVQQILFMVLATLFLLLGFDFIWLVIASVITLPIGGIMQIFVIRRNKIGPPRLSVNHRLWFGVLRAGLPFAATHLSLSFAYQIDTIFLSQYTSDAVVGWYNAAYRLVLAILTISRAFNDAALPTLSREHVKNPEAVRTWYFATTRFILMISIPIAIGGSLLSQQIIYIFGAQFSPAALALAILIWDIPFVMLHGFGGNIASSIKRESNAARIFVTIGLLNLALNALLVPRFGLVAACFATVITDLVGSLLFYFLFRKEFGPGIEYRKILRVLLCAFIMGAFVWLLQSVTIFVLIPLAALLYAGLLWASGALSVEERLHIVSLLRRGSNMVLRHG